MGEKNIILIISGPAGSGKNTVAERLMGEYDNVKRVITSTSRPPRGTEVDGVDYHFLSPEQFERDIAAGKFYEYAKVHDRYYGTSKKAVSESLERGNDLILIIDVQGAETWRRIAAEHPELAEKLTSVFIAPDSIDELRRRLKGRATESDADIDRRMKTAEYEFGQADKFDRRIDSKTKDEDYAALKKIYLDIKGVK